MLNDKQLRARNALRPPKGPHPVNPKKRAKGPMWGSRKRLAVQMVQKNYRSPKAYVRMLSDIKKDQEKKKH